MLALGVDHRLGADGGPRGAGLRGPSGSGAGSTPPRPRSRRRPNSCLLSTCNRVELYAAAEGGARSTRRPWRRRRRRLHDVLPVAMLDGHLVAPPRCECGRRPPVPRRRRPGEPGKLGEGQILGQVREPPTSSQPTVARPSGRSLHHVFQPRRCAVSASGSARRRAWTVGKCSVASCAAVDVARAVFDRFAGGQGRARHRRRRDGRADAPAPGGPAPRRACWSPTATPRGPTPSAAPLRGPRDPL